MRKVKISFWMISAWFFFSAMGLCGCGARVSDRVKVGATPVAEIKKILGEPSRSWKPDQVPQSEVLAFKADPACTYQREGAVIVQVACSPKPHETELQYWLHVWAGDRMTHKRGDFPGEHWLFNLKRKAIVLYDAQGNIRK